MQGIERPVTDSVDRIRPILVTREAERHHTLMALRNALVAIARDVMNIYLVSSAGNAWHLAHGSMIALMFM